MTDNNKAQQDPAATNGNPGESGDKPFLTGTYKGQKVSWDAEKARELAQKGLDYETKKAKLDAERQSLQGSTEEFNKFTSWRDELSRDPAKAEAVRRAYMDPQSVLKGDDGGADGSSPPVAQNGELREMKEQVKQLRSEISEMSSSAKKQSIEDRVGRAAESFDFLSKNPEAQSLVKSQARLLMLEDSDIGPEAAASIAAEKVKGLMRGDAQKKLDNQDKKKGLKTVNTESGTPLGSQTERKPDPMRLKRGGVMANIRKELEAGSWGERFPNL